MISNWYFGLLIVLLTIGISIAGVLVARSRISSELLKGHNEIAAPIHGTIGVIYAVIVGFVIIVVWQQFNVADDAVSYEAESAIALDRDLAEFDRDARIAAHDALIDYVEMVLLKEWGLMEVGDDIDNSTPVYRELWRTIRQITPRDEREKIWLESLVERMNSLDEARQQRLLAAGNSVPSAMWIMMICGGLITLLFAAFFGAEHGPIHMVMVSALAALIAFSLFLIAAIDFPFAGIVRVDSAPFEEALRELKRNNVDLQQSPLTSLPTTDSTMSDSMMIDSIP